MTKKEIVLRALKYNIHVTGTQLMQLGAGSRYGARIDELRKEGWQIKSAPDPRSKTYRYWLTDQFRHEPPENAAGPRPNYAARITAALAVLEAVHATDFLGMNEVNEAVSETIRILKGEK